MPDEDFLYRIHIYNVTAVEQVWWITLSAGPSASSHSRFEDRNPNSSIQNVRVLLACDEVKGGGLDKGLLVFGQVRREDSAVGDDTMPRLGRPLTEGQPTQGRSHALRKTEQDLVPWGWSLSICVLKASRKAT